MCVCVCVCVRQELRVDGAMFALQIKEDEEREQEELKAKEVQELANKVTICLLTWIDIVKSPWFLHARVG